MGANAQTSVPVFTAGQVLTAAQVTQLNTGIPVFATTTTRDAAFGGTGEKTLAQGQYAYIEATSTLQVYSGTAWITATPTPQIAIFNETQAAGTQGGTNTTGAWTKRILNTTIQNGITGCSIASSVITLPAGTYYVWANAPFYRTNRAPIRLQNTSDSTTAIIPQSSYMVSAYENQGISNFMGYFTIAATKNFEVQYYSQTSQADNGLGLAMNYGLSEVFAQISIEKVA
jgi:hypothetical protein